MLPAADALPGRVLEVLEDIRRACSGERPSLVAVSSLAEGADRLLAELVLAPPIAGALLVVLPLELSDYRQDFASETSLAEFQSLLSQADELIFPPLAAPRSVGRDTPPPLPTSETREAGYEWAGQEVVNRCDVLVALWDGQPSRGRGGTAEIIAYARQAGRSSGFAPRPLMRSYKSGWKYFGTNGRIVEKTLTGSTVLTGLGRAGAPRRP